MTSCIHTRVRAALPAALAGAIVICLACSGSGGSAPYDILSPASRHVTVAPGATVRFEIRTNGGRSVEYVVDDARTEPGPVFILQPTAQHHDIEALILPADLASAPDIVLFTVDVESPGNLPPQITSFTVEPASGEAGDTEFTAHVTAADADGTVDSVSVDFGDGSAPIHGTEIPFTATYTYNDEGTYTVTARAVDDDGVPATSTRQIPVGPRNDPPTGSLHSELISGGPPQGTGPLTVRLRTQGMDPDGSIATWELDKDSGEGFQLIAPAEVLVVTYPFQEDHYMPVLRLTDNLGRSTEIMVDQDIVVLRDVSSARSSYTVTGNSVFSKTAIAPAIWADGSDPMRFEVHVRDSEDMPVPGARVRVSTNRPPRIAPDGSQLGTSESVVPSAELTADQSGTVMGSLVTETSTRVEAMPIIDFKPFNLVFEVDLGRDIWVPLELDPVDLNANTTISAGGRVTTHPELLCPGQTLEIVVEAEGLGGAPGGKGAVGGKYAELLFTNEQPLPGYRPASGFGNWRTNGSGTIRFVYTPVRADQSKLFLAWVDGQPLGDVGSIFLKPPAQCGGV
jgi:PKD repeat protein